jgi:hypothetical protein
LRRSLCFWLLPAACCLLPAACCLLPAAWDWDWQVQAQMLLALASFHNPQMKTKTAK